MACNPASPGIWNAATGNSGGFNDWRIDLSAYAGQQVEVSIVYQTDPATLGHRRLPRRRAGDRQRRR